MAKVAVAETNDNKLTTRIKSWPQRTKGFLGDVRNEMRKVTSPSRKEVQATTTVVIITVFIFGVYFWAIDGVIGRSLDYMIRNFSGR
ncbi:MAG TPA: preprotein translocase subunit SecE [Clostridia bacterium]|nr:preprotein translocase subunit SecE [Clostridia bacterium]